MAGEQSASAPKLHPLELLTPFVLLAILGFFALPNYFDYRPRADLRRAAGDLVKLIETARKVSQDKSAAGIRFHPLDRSAALWTKKDANDSEKPEETWSLPNTLNFGYAPGTPPLPGLVLENGTNLAATDDGITFMNDQLVLNGGRPEGYPGIIYLRNNRGDQLAIYIRVSGQVEVHEWHPSLWKKLPDLNLPPKP